MVKSRDGCGAVGEKRCQWRMVGLCNASKLECGNGGRWGKGLMAMNRLMIGFNGAVDRKFACFL
ncbi:hypothetical protein [Bartonella sp. OC16QHHD]|uniref:hypothetical protein n=1 Tax=Bartonella sp. OC16QHHD TaxID=3243562 RepID=UPI0035D13620